MIAEDAVIAREETALSSQVEDRVMIMNIDTGTYYEIDKSAARIWDLLEQPKNFGELCDSLCQVYEVEREQCRSDTAAFLDELTDLRLIRIEK
tara:strand:+ start:651 stop:929 length:279 start_codon:yes stop_codon:yes gene_type:complete